MPIFKFYQTSLNEVNEIFLNNSLIVILSTSYSQLAQMLHRCFLQLILQTSDQKKISLE